MDKLQKIAASKDAAWLLRQTPSSIGNVTLLAATSPEAYPIRRMMKDHGEHIASSWIGLVLEEADLMCGAKNPPHVLAMFGRMVLQNFAHRSVESLVLAIRDGLNGKVYGALTYPQIAEWLNDHEQAIVGLAEGEAAQHRFTGDNLGAAYLDRLEHQSDPNKMKRASDRIAQLERQLSTKDTNTSAA